MADVKSGVLLAASLLTLCGSGCAYGELKQVLRAQFASELDCPDVSIRRRDTWYAYSENHFKVTGCGHLRTYTCEEGSGVVSYGSPPCKWIDGDIDAPQGPKAEGGDPVTEPMPDEAPLPPLDEPSSSSSGSSSDSSSSDGESTAEPSGDDGLGGSDLTGEASAEPSKPAKVKASAGIKLGR